VRLADHPIYWRGAKVTSPVLYTSSCRGVLLVGRRCNSAFYLYSTPYKGGAGIAQSV
jgi:hypothetical protein